MKKVKLKVLIALILTVTVIYNCKEPDSIEVSQEKESVITNYVLKKATNNSKGLVNYSVINITKEDIYSAKSFNNKINELANLSLNKNTYSSILYYNGNQLIGYELFFEEEAYLKHSFYLKKDEMFEKVFELLDNKIDPTNVEFIISFYLTEYNDLDAKLLINKSFNYNNYEEQKSEFGLFKNAIIYNSKLNIEGNSGKASSKELPMIGCSAICDAMGWGSCNFETLECTGCNKSSRSSKLLSDESFTVEIINQMLIDNDDLHYDFRDFLENSTKYKKLISYYYSLDAFIDLSFFDLNDISDIFSVIPSVDIALDELLNGTDPNAIIIDTNLKNDIITLLNNVKSKSNNIDFQFILNDIIAEINNLSGKTKNQIVNGL